jgi:NAD(P)-dependent dehydrogenase (short-subunit alcohol dehydrogenase family)
MRHIIVFGAASGFGYALSVKLLDLGHQVYAIDRVLEGMNPLKAKGAKVFVADVTNDASIQQAIASIVGLTNHIHAVVNNVGYGMYGPVERPIEDIVRQFDVNLFGYARVNNAVLPLFRAQRSGTVIMTASVVSHISTTGLGWYAATKHAVKAMAEALRMEVMDLGIHVVQIEPGPVKTKFHATANATYPTKLHADYRPVIQAFERFQNRLYANAPSDQSTIKALVHACVSDKPKWVYRTTLQAKAFALLRPLLSNKLYARIVRLVER